MRFGEYLLQKGFLTNDQINNIIIRQEEYSKKGTKKFFGEIAVELNYIDSDIVEQEFFNYCNKD